MPLQHVRDFHDSRGTRYAHKAKLINCICERHQLSYTSCSARALRACVFCGRGLQYFIMMQLKSVYVKCIPRTKSYSSSAELRCWKHWDSKMYTYIHYYSKHPTAFSGKETGTAITLLEITAFTNCQHACLWETRSTSPNFWRIYYRSLRLPM